MSETAPTGLMPTIETLRGEVLKNAMEIALHG